MIWTLKEIGNSLSIPPTTIRMRLSRMKNRRLITGYGGKYWIENGVIPVTDVISDTGVTHVM